MIKINSYQTIDYTTLIQGNDGEEQLSIMMSSGQNGKTAIVVVAIQVDFGLNILSGGGRVEIPTNNIVDWLRPVLHSWVGGGIRPTQEEKLEQYKLIEEILSANREEW